MTYLINIFSSAILSIVQSNFLFDYRDLVSKYESILDDNYLRLVTQHDFLILYFYYDQVVRVLQISNRRHVLAPLLWLRTRSSHQPKAQAKVKLRKSLWFYVVLYLSQCLAWIFMSFDPYTLCCPSISHTSTKDKKRQWTSSSLHHLVVSETSMTSFI